MQLSPYNSQIHKMKTFAETQNKKPFDWNKFLNKKKITEAEWRKATSLAREWPTCACGNQCAIIPRHNIGFISIGEPTDEKLSKLGREEGFYGAIKNRNIKAAKSFLQKIEKRSAILIKREVEKAKKIYLETINLTK